MADSIESLLPHNHHHQHRTTTTNSTTPTNTNSSNSTATTATRPRLIPDPEARRRHSASRPRRRIWQPPTSERPNGTQPRYPPPPPPPLPSIMPMGILQQARTTGQQHQQQQAAPVETPAEIAGAARAPFVFGAAPAVRANAGRRPALGQYFPRMSPSGNWTRAAAGSMMSAVRRGGAINLYIVTDDPGHTVLHWAAALGRLELVSVLLAARPLVRSAGPQAAPLATDVDVLISSSSS
ncbi:hypothetical protein CF328_g6263 [Tilletia controversa]|nr:hypothetical protein CF328_g6263 [Tilletia controversa]